jgi:N6-adenosine-specific RNA methylase IME4
MKTDAVASPSDDLLESLKGQKFQCILADPPWQFVNRTGKMAPEHKRLSRYGTMDLAAISALPVPALSAAIAHLYLWTPNALLPEACMS